MEDDSVEEGNGEDECGESSIGEILSDEERDLLVKRLASYGLPTREIIWITGTSGRTVARVMQRWGVTRKRPDGFRSFRKGYSRCLPEILRRYYDLKEVTLDTLDHLARGSELSLKLFLNLIRENVSPSRWAIRTCLGSCGQSTLTPSPAERYCLTCKKKIKKDRKNIDNSAIHE